MNRLGEKALYYANCAAGESVGSRMVEIFRAAMIDAITRETERQRECISECAAALRQVQFCQGSILKQGLCDACQNVVDATLARAAKLLGDERQIDQPSHTEGHIDCPACDLNRWELLRKERAER